MRHSCIGVLLFLTLAPSAVAQGFTRGEVFGGYQYTRINPGGLNANGWDAAAQVNLSGRLGLKADFSGAYKSVLSGGARIRRHTYLFGPVLSARSERSTVFVHALFGGAHANFGGGGTGLPPSGDSAFAMAFGGGFDWNAKPNLAIRIGQFDYLPTRFGGTTQNNFRYSVGIVFRF